jgi:hypothetical protein
MLNILFGSSAAVMEGGARRHKISRSGEIKKRCDLPGMGAVFVFSRVWREKDVALKGDIKRIIEEKASAEKGDRC